MPGSNNALNNTILDIARFGTTSRVSTSQVAIVPSISAAGVSTGLLVNPIFSASSATVYAQIVAPAFNPPAGGNYNAAFGLSIAPAVGPGRITNAYGLRISSVSAQSNTIANAASLFVANASGSGSILNNYTAILGTDSSALVGIGDTSPRQTLSVAGAASAFQVIGASLGTTDNNQLVNLAEGYNQGGLGGGSAGTNKQMSLNTTQFFDLTAGGTLSIPGFSSGICDGRYIYFVPVRSEGTVAVGNIIINNLSGTIARYDTTLPFTNAGSYTLFDLTQVSTQAQGFWGALFDGRYVYLTPETYLSNPVPLFVRYDTSFSFNAPSSYTIFNLMAVGSGAAGYAGGAFDGRYLYLAPSYGGGYVLNSTTIVRYDTTLSFTVAASYSVFNTLTIEPSGTAGFGAVYDGRYVYFVPYLNKQIRGSTTVIRYDTTLSFSSGGSYSLFNMNQAQVGFSSPYYGGLFDGRYVYYCPTDYGAFLAPTRMVPLARYDTLRPFDSPSSYTAFNLRSIDPSNRGTNLGGVFDGRYLYIAHADQPPSRGSTIVRYDTTQEFHSISSYTCLGIGNAISFRGALFDGRYVYFLPSDNGYQEMSGTVVRIDAYPGPLATAFAANQAPNGLAIGRYAGMSAANSNTLLVSGNVGINTSNPQYTLDVEGTIRAQFIIAQLDTTTSIHALTTNNQMVNLEEGYNQSGFGSGIAGLNKTMSANTINFLDTTALSDGSRDFTGALFDGIYVYFVPGQIDGVPSGTVSCYDTRLPFASISSYACFDLSKVNSNCVGFWGALYDERYVYFIPYSSGVVARYDTTQLFSATASYTAFDTAALSTYSQGFIGGVFDGRYIYFSPNNVNGINSGTVTRYDTESSFTAIGSYSCFDLATVNSNNLGFVGAAFDGRYVYFVPNNSNTSGIVVQYDTSKPFGGASSYTIFDLTDINTNCVGFYNAVFDGAYVYFVPNKGGTSGLAVRFDTTQPFTSILAYQTFDTAAVSSQSLGFAGAAFDNRYVYFIPGQPNSGEITRYDTTLPFNNVSSYSFIDTAAINSNSVQFMGAAYDGRYLFLAPAANGQITRVDAYPGQQATAMVANAAPNGFAVGSFAGAGSPNNASYANSLIVGGNIGVNTPYPANQLEVVGTVSATNLLVNNFFPKSGTYNSQIAALSQGYNQGGFGGGSVGTDIPLSANTTSLFDMARVNSFATGFSGAVFDGRFIYYVPFNYGVVLRYDTMNLMTASSSYGAFDLTTINSSAHGFYGAVFDGQYVYYVPAYDGPAFTSGTIVRYDTNQDFYTPASYSVFDTKAVSSNACGFWGAVYDGRYIYYIPTYPTHATIVRYDTQLSFAVSSSYSTFNARTVNANDFCFSGGVYDGRYVYYVPSTFGLQAYVLRYDTTKSFSSAGSYANFNLAALNIPGPLTFIGAVFDSRYIYFVPFGSGTLGYITRYDTLQTFTSASSYTTFNVSAVSSGSVGFRGGVFDGRYVYFVPNYSGSSGFNYGTITRYDTTLPFNAASSYSFLDVSQINSHCIGFFCAIFDGSNVYFVPNQHGVVVCINAYPGPLATSMAASQAPSGFAIGSYAGTPAPIEGMIVGGYTGVGTSSPAYPLDVAGTINAPKLIVTSPIGMLGQTSNNQLSALSQGYNQGGFGGGSVGTNKQMSLSSATTFDLQTIDPHFEGYRGAVFDGRYIYLVPCFGATNSQSSGTALRYDSTLPISSASSYTAFDLTQLNSGCKGYAGGVYDGQYVYFVPQSNTNLCRYDTTQSFNLTSSYSIFNLRTVNASENTYGALFDGRYIYFGPSSTKILIRYDMTLPFSAVSSYTSINLTAFTLTGFIFPGTYDGRYIYFTPFSGNPALLRYDTAGSFTLINNWTTYDLTTAGGNTNYYGASFDGRYIYFAPSDATVVRYDTQQSFTSTNSYAAFGVRTSLSNLSASIYSSAIYDGRYVYFAPRNSGWAARYDTTLSYTIAGSWTLLNLANLNTNCIGYEGAIFDGRSIYFVPCINASAPLIVASQFTRIDAYTGPQAASLAASGAPNGFAIGSYAGTAAPLGGGLIVSGNVGIGIATPTWSIHLATDSAAQSGPSNLWTVNSDARIKENIQDITDALSTIRQLRARTFNYHPAYAKDVDADENRTYYGFIADEVEKVLEGCVKGSGMHCYGGKMKNRFDNAGSAPEPIPGMENLKAFDMHNILVFSVQAVRELAENTKRLQEQLSERKKRSSN